MISIAGIISIPVYLQFNKISQNLFPHFCTFFGMELRSVKIIPVQSRAVFNSVFGCCNGMLAQSCIKAMHKITVTVFFYSLKQRCFQIVNIVPAYLWYFNG